MPSSLLSQACVAAMLGLLGTAAAAPCSPCSSHHTHHTDMVGDQPHHFMSSLLRISGNHAHHGGAPDDAGIAEEHGGESSPHMVIVLPSRASAEGSSALSPSSHHYEHGSLPLPDGAAMSGPMPPLSTDSAAYAMLAGSPDAAAAATAAADPNAPPPPLATGTARESSAGMESYLASLGIDPNVYEHHQGGEHEGEPDEGDMTPHHPATPLGDVTDDDPATPGSTTPAPITGELGMGEAKEVSPAFALVVRAQGKSETFACVSAKGDIVAPEGDGKCKDKFYIARDEDNRLVLKSDFGYCDVTDYGNLECNAVSIYTAAALKVKSTGALAVPSGTEALSFKGFSDTFGAQAQPGQAPVEGAESQATWPLFVRGGPAATADLKNSDLQLFAAPA